jgi:hypothetical protein
VNHPETLTPLTRSINCPHANGTLQTFSSSWANINYQRVHAQIIQIVTRMSAPAENTTNPKPKNRRGRKRMVLRSACALGAVGAAIVGVSAAIVALCYTTPLSYLYCCARENSWLAAKTESDLDRRILAFYTKQPIAPSNSMWGWDYTLKPDERMVQYLIFAKEPLDVVFDRDSRVVAAFTSYE